MILYQWDEQGYYIADPASIEVADDAPMPERTTPTKPMKLTGEQVAQWQGQWVKFASRPVDPDPVPLPEPVPDWPALIAARRYTAETAGTIIQGMPIDTGRDSQALITGATVAAMLDADYSIRWKTAAGFVELTGAQVIGVASAVRAYVQSCFDCEAELLDAVASGSITSAMLDEGWPA
ncbi:DUF4376 domain-containing protein [Pseudomonas sp. DSP3-2-2]|uniref:DUF4376 domain-containing protein n=1 Tax=unclassified Pseudomonas TaxID=196821 RepID=UPI003CF45E5A